MLFYFIAFSVVVWVSIRYFGIFLSWLLSVVIRCPLEIGSVGWWRLSDVRIRLPSGLNVYVDICQLQLKPLLLSLSNVKVEGDAQSLAQASPTRRTGVPPRRTDSKHSLFSRVTQLIQYCGLYVSRGQVVLFDAPPGCIFHLAARNIMFTDASKSYPSPEHDGSLPFRSLVFNLDFSVDIAEVVSKSVFPVCSTNLKSMETPSSCLEMPLTMRKTYQWQKELFSIELLIGLCIETNNCGESRMLTIALRGLSVTKDSGKTQTRVVGLSVEDQRQRLALRTSLLVLSHEGQSPPVAPSTPPRIPVTFSVEVASIFCDLVDADAFQSTLSVQFLSITKEEHMLEVGVDCLCIAGPSIRLVDATFERHQWGQV
ncbi:hypothetical protein OSTOST_22625, partial [Ostertagia ostertagi]